MRDLLNDLSEGLSHPDPILRAVSASVEDFNTELRDLLVELEAASGARAAWLVRFGESQLPTATTVLQDGDQLVLAVTDEITARVHDVVENAAQGGER